MKESVQRSHFYLHGPTRFASGFDPLLSRDSKLSP